MSVERLKTLGDEMRLLRDQMDAIADRMETLATQICVEAVQVADHLNGPLLTIGSLDQINYTCGKCLKRWSSKDGFHVCRSGGRETIAIATPERA